MFRIHTVPGIHGYLEYSVEKWSSTSRGKQEILIYFEFTCKITKEAVNGSFTDAVNTKNEKYFLLFLQTISINLYTYVCL